MLEPSAADGREAPYFPFWHFGAMFRLGWMPKWKYRLTLFVIELLFLSHFPNG